MTKVKVLIVEDEIVIADHLCHLLNNLGYTTTEPAINYTEAIQYLKEEDPDIALLDIQLAGQKDGIELAWTIKNEYKIPFIFLTSNADPRTIERVKDLNPHSYLVKPFNKDDLYTSIELALYNFNQHRYTQESAVQKQLIVKDAFFIKDRNFYHKVLFDNILYAKSDHVYIEIYTSTGKTHLIRNTMNEFHKELPEYFFRTHRSFIVNLNHVEGINSRFVKIQSQEIPIGKSYRDLLLNQVHIP